jgi:hypothetical protein
MKDKDLTPEQITEKAKEFLPLLKGIKYSDAQAIINEARLLLAQQIQDVII